MSKGLEAFNRFTDNIRWLQENTSLKNYFENEKLYFKEDLDIIETALKALDIIKKKRVNVEWLLETENVEEYNESLYNNLTNDEYDLLKEVL